MKQLVYIVSILVLTLIIGSYIFNIMNRTHELYVEYESVNKEVENVHDNTYKTYNITNVTVNYKYLCYKPKAIVEFSDTTIMLTRTV